MSKTSIVRDCDKCGNEDSINTMSGLCSSCELVEDRCEDCHHYTDSCEERRCWD